MQGLPWFRPPPVRKSSSLKQFHQATGCICWKEQSVFHLSEPSPSACKLLGGGQAVAEPSKPCPLLKIRKIHVIHVSSQWLSLLSVLSSKDPRSPRGPQAPQIHRSTESTEPGSSPDLLDLSYAAMQILTVLIYCFYRQLLIQHAHAVKNQSIFLRCLCYQPWIFTSNFYRK